MFNIFNKQTLLALGVAVAVIAGCKKEGIQTAVVAGPKPVLTALNSNMVFTEDIQDSIIEKFTFTPTTFGYQAAITYALQFDVKGNGFANAQTVPVPGVANSFTVKALNLTAAALKMPFGSSTAMVVRVKATIGTTQLLDAATAYSDSIVLMVNPYKVLPQYPKIFVPGSYTSPTWDPGTAPALASPKSDKVYQGFLLFSDNSLFKFTLDRSWANNYGGTATSLVSNGDNLSVAAAGLRYLVADINALTWNSTAISSFSLNGTATTNADIDLIAEDATDMTWSTTVNLTAGNFFIRANHANTIAYGDTDADNITEPATGGNGIQIATAGKYKITFDVSNAGIYLYTVTLVQ